MAIDSAQILENDGICDAVQQYAEAAALTLTYTACGKLWPWRRDTMYLSGHAVVPHQGGRCTCGREEMKKDKKN